ncbi:MAG: hypothetical protein WCP20_21920 [Desulfuromonadales bacterium]
MLTQKKIDARLSALSGIVSDMSVGLGCLDGPEVVYEARTLKDRADGYGLYQLGLLAHEIEQAAVAGDLDTVRQLFGEIHGHLQQAPLLMQ